MRSLQNDSGFFLRSVIALLPRPVIGASRRETRFQGEPKVEKPLRAISRLHPGLPWELPWESEGNLERWKIELVGTLAGGSGILLQYLISHVPPQTAAFRNRAFLLIGLMSQASFS
jgi:hypothetical protein